MDSKSQRKRDIMKFFNLQIKLDIAVVNMTLCMSQYVQLTDGTFYVNKDEKLKHVMSSWIKYFFHITGVTV